MAFIDSSKQNKIAKITKETLKSIPRGILYDALDDLQTEEQEETLAIDIERYCSG